MVAADQLTEKEREERRQRKVNRMNGLQFSPVSGIPMTLFLLYMAGNEINMFSIMICFSAISGPITTFANTGAQFAQFQGDDEVKEDLWRCKLVYMVMCVAALLVGLAKLHFMSLLPTSAADWIDHAPPQYITLAQPAY